MNEAELINFFRRKKKPTPQVYDLEQLRLDVLLGNPTHITTPDHWGAKHNQIFNDLLNPKCTLEQEPQLIAWQKNYLQEKEIRDLKAEIVEMSAKLKAAKVMVEKIDKPSYQSQL